MSTFRRALLLLFCTLPIFAAFPVGWTQKCPVVIQHAQVTGNQTAIPVLLTKDTFVTNCGTILTIGGGAQLDGGDLRISSDAAGSSQLALEVVVWSQNAVPSLANVELWTPVNVLSASDVTIYIWFNAGGGQTQPAVNAAFGRNAVWSADGNFQGGVAHLANGTVLTVVDSTGINTYTNNGMVAATGIVDGSGGSNGLTQDAQLGTLATVFNGVQTVVTVEYWAFSNQPTNAVKSEPLGTGGSAAADLRCVFGNDGATNNVVQILLNTSGTFGNNFKAVSSTATTLTASTWFHVAMVLDMATLSNSKIYVNGASVAVSLATVGSPTSVLSTLGSSAQLMLFGSQRLDGALDEVRISNVARSATWIGTEYNNMISPGTFAIAGAPISSGSSNTPAHGRVM